MLTHRLFRSWFVLGFACRLPEDDDTTRAQKIEIARARQNERERKQREAENEQRSMADWEAEKSSAVESGGSKHGRARSSMLWVDRYAPRKFTDLLSAELTNREVLKWIKTWDECVFGHANHSAFLAEQRELKAKQKREAAMKLAEQSEESSSAADAAALRELNRPPQPSAAAIHASQGRNFLNPFAAIAHASPARGVRRYLLRQSVVSSTRSHCNYMVCFDYIETWSCRSCSQTNRRTA